MKNEAQALAAQQDAARREDDHGPALAMNAERDRLQALDDHHLADNLGALTDAADNDLWPTDEDLVDALVEAFNMDRRDIIARVAKFDSVSALAELEAA